MLRTNSKKALENVMNYILEDSEYLDERAEYDEIQLETPADYCTFIIDCFNDEYAHEIKRRGAAAAFEEWARGLALGGLFLYYYNVSAVETVAKILEETPEESARYTEEQAESLLTSLIYRVCAKNYAAGSLKKKIDFDFYHGGTLEDVAAVDCSFNDLSCTYSGWMYDANGGIIGDFTALDSLIVNKYFPGIFEEQAA